MNDLFSPDIFCRHPCFQLVPTVNALCDSVAQTQLDYVPKANLWPQQPCEPVWQPSGLTTDSGKVEVCRQRATCTGMHISDQVYDQLATIP